MPSPRKRIGFLPSIEVQKIIEEICRENNYSHSKVTGLLVEEALISRGSLKSRSSLKLDKKKDIDNQINCSGNKDSTDNYDIENIKNIILKDDIKMINEFIQYKFFKKIMNKNKDIFI